MSTPHIALSPETPPRTDTATHTRIDDPRFLGVVRVTWVGLTFLAVLLYLVALPMRFNQLNVVCSGSPCATLQLTPSGVDALQQLGIPFNIYAYVINLEDGIFALMFFSVGVLIFWRRSDDWMAIFVSLTLIIFGMTLPSTMVALATGVSALNLAANVLRSLSQAMFVILFYLFPDGRFVPRWTRWLAVLLSLVHLFIPFTYGSPIWILIFTFTTATGVFAQVYRYARVSDRVERQQTKWVVVGFAAVLFGIAMALLPYWFISSDLNPPIAPVSSQADLFYRVVYVFIFTFIPIFLLPVSISVAALRYRLWAVDLVLNRGLVYGGLTVLLGIVFFGGLFILQAILNGVLGGQQTTTAAIIATAVIVGLFNPARRLLQNFVDRRFYHLRLDLNQLADLQKPKAIPNPGALSGTTLGAYQVGDVLGRGGMGEVYKGHQTGLDRPVAIKVLPPELAHNAEILARFEREAKIVAKLRHPNIVGVFDFGNANGTHYMVMEFVDGEALNYYIHTHAGLGFSEASQILQDIAGALDYAHAQGLVHRDVKPSNIMLEKITTTGTGNTTLRPSKAILMDFGITKYITSGSGLTHTGALGTIDYMAPEQIMSAKEVDHRADIYALGVVLYEMLTGEPPFKGGAGQVLFAHLQQPPPDPRDIKADVPSQASKAVIKAMAKKPEDRFQSAGEFAAAVG